MILSLKKSNLILSLRKKTNRKRTKLSRKRKINQRMTPNPKKRIQNPMMTIKQDNEGIKHDDPPSTSTNDDPSATPISNTLPTSTTSDSDSSLASINLANPRQTLDASTNPSIQLTAPTPTDDLLP